MTRHRFYRIASATADHFWPLVFMHLSPREVDYIRQTPRARRTIEFGIANVLARALLTESQMAEYAREQENRAARDELQPPLILDEPLSDDPDVDDGSRANN